MEKDEWVPLPKLGRRHTKACYTVEAKLAKKNRPSTFRDKDKLKEARKKLYNRKNVVMVRDVFEFLAQLSENPARDMSSIKVLVLDGKYACTTTALVEAGILLENIYICSDEIEFSGFPDGNTYTGKLSDFLRILNAKNIRFTAVICDFCGTYAGDQRTSVEYLFTNRMLSAVAVFSITICKRVKKTEPENKNVRLAHAIVSFGEIKTTAYFCGYSTGTVDKFDSEDVVSLSMKVMFTGEAMENDTGYGHTRDGKYADDWHTGPFIDMPINDEEEDEKDDEEQVEQPSVAKRPRRKCRRD